MLGQKNRWKVMKAVHDSRFKIQDSRFSSNKITVVGGSIANSLVPQLKNATDPETYKKLTIIGKYLQK